MTSIKLNIKPGEEFLTINANGGIELSLHKCKEINFSENGMEFLDGHGIGYPEKECYHDIIALRLAFDYAVDELSDEIRRNR